MECLQPVRSADYSAHPPLSMILALPENAQRSSGATIQTVLDAWDAYLGRDDLSLLLVKSADRARKLLMAAFGIADGEPVGIPVNTRRALSEAVKKSKGTPRFIELDPELEFVADTPGLRTVRLTWAQPVAGMPAPQPLPDATLFVDYGFTLPAPLPGGAVPGTAIIWGLHLADRDDGALIAFADRELYEVASQLVSEDDIPDLDRALAQCHRLSGEDGVAARQQRVLAEVVLGMEAGAGMPMALTANAWALPFGLPVRVPSEADVPTFISYVRNEHVDLDWLPELQPMFYVAYQVTRDLELTQQSAENLARWIISPVGVDFVDDEITHAVLGILKAAEYTGVRWYTDPERAAWYGNLMIEWYGPTHDAFRPAFLTQDIEGVYLPPRSLVEAVAD